ncbi:MAG: hypothetical protein INQ03_11450 [Candidatus Heimdallarchaeota archaeon]|nr:hypothetical protein [Candidatus Heimdallarchaeota archaeon]
MSNSIFTNEAEEIYSKFVDELQQELTRSDLSKTERENTMEDVKKQILDLCEFKEEIISTDTLRHVLNKIGSPREIISTLTREHEFINDVEDNVVEKLIPDKHLFKAREIVDFLFSIQKFMKLIKFPLFFSMWLWFVDNDFAILYGILLIFYQISFIQYVKILFDLNIDKKLVRNMYLLKNVRPKPIILYPTFALLIIHLGLIIFANRFNIFLLLLVVPLVITLGYYINIFYSNKQYYL